MIRGKKYPYIGTLELSPSSGLGIVGVDYAQDKIQFQEYHAGSVGRLTSSLIRHDTTGLYFWHKAEKYYINEFTKIEKVVY